MVACVEVVRLIDSTTIDLCKQQFRWATFRSGKAGVKVHTVCDPKAKVPTFFSITAASKHHKRTAEKWIKQNLKIKCFVGRSENAVKTQIIIAMIAYLLLKLANASVASVLSLYQLATLLSVTLMERRNIDELMLQKHPPKPPEINLNQLSLGLG